MVNVFCNSLCSMLYNRQEKTLEGNTLQKYYIVSSIAILKDWCQPSATLQQKGKRFSGDTFWNIQKEMMVGTMLALNNRRGSNKPCLPISGDTPWDIQKERMVGHLAERHERNWWSLSFIIGHPTGTYRWHSK